MNITIKQSWDKILGGILFVERPNLWSLEAGCLIRPVEKYAIFPWKWFISLAETSQWGKDDTHHLADGLVSWQARQETLSPDDQWWWHRGIMQAPLIFAKYKCKHCQTLANTRSPGLNATLLALMFTCPSKTSEIQWHKNIFKLKQSSESRCWCL